jgi:hypothetical protein
MRAFPICPVNLLEIGRWRRSLRVYSAFSQGKGVTALHHKFAPDATQFLRFCDRREEII